MNATTADAVPSDNLIPFPHGRVAEESGSLQHLSPAPQPAPRPAPPSNTARFTYRGREYTLYKRAASASAPWYFRVQRAGKPPYKQSLGTNAQVTAIAKAKLILEAADKGELEAMRAVLARRSVITNSPLSDIVNAWEKMPLDISETHRRNCVYSLKSVLLRAGHGNEDAWDWSTLSAGLLNEATARAYFDSCIAEAKRQDDQEDEARIKRSANSTFAQALCMFRPKVLSNYRRAGFQLPDIQPMADVFDQEKFSGIHPIYNPPPAKVIDATLHAWVSLTDRNMFLALGLELACGLRKAEVAQVTWGMFASTKDGALLDGRGRVKNGKGMFVVPPIDPFWTVLNHRIEREKWRGEADDLVLAGSLTERTDDTFRRIGDWMRALGWKTQKTNHALRAYSGSLVAMKFGIYRASAWLRHAGVKITQGRYTHFLDGRVFRPESVLIRWARPAKTSK